MNEVMARAAARQRLLNSLVREVGGEVGADSVRIPLRSVAAGTARHLSVEVRHRSEIGHHAYGAEVFRGGTALEHEEFVALVAEELAARCTAVPAGAVERFRRQVANSVARSARYLDRTPPGDPVAPEEITRRAEQSLLLGHPFHPTPKSAEGISDDDLERFAPELGASFRLHHWAVAPELLVEDRVGDGPWLPDEHPSVLPVHPWQDRYLREHSRVQELVAAGLLTPLGPVGAEVYATSSVRTVCDPGFSTAWKLPLHVRITNFVRNNPFEHLRRAADAGRLVAAVEEGWKHEGFEVLPETGYRALDPSAMGELTADFAVLFRRNPFAGTGIAPRVLAALLEDRVDGRPELIGLVEQAGPLTAEHACEWLDRYLRISLGPLLAVFTDDGVGFEAHVQNSLLHIEGGWPSRFYVRDMEGTSADRERVPEGVLPPGSPVLYDDSEAWQRLQYHLVTNHLGHVVAVLGRFTPAGERLLWSVVREFLRELPGRYAAELRGAATLPAKANLLSRFAERGETPLYVDIPNPIREESR
ncbi:IucA/IucC family protein [Saccharopolyspora mangrovi]|uniref:IucA/IucC family protein n=1 Tax=Saccharopolyspora mangrovi TaxID=3082379 RepID=A0ABU6AAW8_9PSEU|nr:IucA/IucC family protein [Saccharopolyspora sp. S2-29]MEB3368626.1 IucA/IucC family protein [Saccharopolyspora sp. S2-29]